MWNHHDMMPHGWGWGLGMGLFWLLVLVGAVFVFAWAMSQFGRDGEAGDSDRDGAADEDESPREVLDRRYAEGELSREDYLQMKRDLEE